MPDMTLERAIQISRIVLANDLTHHVNAHERKEAYDLLAAMPIPKEGEKAGLPVAGYKQTQSQAKIDIVNEGKILEEKVLRYIDKLDADKAIDVDKRFLAVGKTDIQKGFMSVFRSVFPPQRIEGEL